MPSKKLLVSLPRHPIPSRATIEPLSPDPYDTPIELQKALRVCRSAVVLVVASELGVEDLLLLLSDSCCKMATAQSGCECKRLWLLKDSTFQKSKQIWGTKNVYAAV
jgi:hypothetical protein